VPISPCRAASVPDRRAHLDRPVGCARCRTRSSA
jgi:hypothetical protein